MSWIGCVHGLAIACPGMRIAYLAFRDHIDYMILWELNFEDSRMELSKGKRKKEKDDYVPIAERIEGPTKREP